MINLIGVLRGGFPNSIHSLIGYLSEGLTMTQSQTIVVFTHQFLFFLKISRIFIECEGTYYNGKKVVSPKSG